MSRASVPPLLASGIMFLLSGFQIVAWLRYLARLPLDTLGHGLYLATILASAALGVLYLCAWRRSRRTG